MASQAKNTFGFATRDIHTAARFMQSSTMIAGFAQAIEYKQASTMHPQLLHILFENHGQVRTQTPSRITVLAVDTTDCGYALKATSTGLLSLDESKAEVNAQFA